MATVVVVVVARMKGGRIVRIPVPEHSTYDIVAKMVIQGGWIVQNHRITLEEYRMFLHEKYVMP